MELNDLVDSFEAIVDANADVKHFHSGNFSDINVLGKKPFPIALLIAEDGGHDFRMNRGKYNVRLLIIDHYKREKQERKNQNEMWADEKRWGLTIWKAAMTQPEYIYDKSNIDIDFFKEAFGGLYSICEIKAEIQTSECIT